MADFDIEASKAKRMERLKSRMRDRGGTFVPRTKNMLLEILMSKAVNGQSPSRYRPAASQSDSEEHGANEAGRGDGAADERPKRKARKASTVSKPRKAPTTSKAKKTKSSAKRKMAAEDEDVEDGMEVDAKPAPQRKSRKATASKTAKKTGTRQSKKTESMDDHESKVIDEKVAGPSKPAKSTKSAKASTSSKNTSSKKRRRNDEEEGDVLADEESSMPSPGKRRKTAKHDTSNGKKTTKPAQTKRQTKATKKIDKVPPDEDGNSDIDVLVTAQKSSKSKAVLKKNQDPADLADLESVTEPSNKERIYSRIEAVRKDADMVSVPGSSKSNSKVLKGRKDKPAKAMATSISDTESRAASAVNDKHKDQNPSSTAEEHPRGARVPAKKVHAPEDTADLEHAVEPLKKEKASSRSKAVREDADEGTISDNFGSRVEGTKGKSAKTKTTSVSDTESKARDITKDTHKERRNPSAQEEHVREAEMKSGKETGATQLENHALKKSAPSKKRKENVLTAKDSVEVTKKIKVDSYQHAKPEPRLPLRPCSPLVPDSDSDPIDFLS